MVVGSGANLKIVGRVPRVARISARLMVEERDVHGQEKGKNARNLRGEKVGYVLHIVACCRSESPTKEVLLDLVSSMGLYQLLRQQPEPVWRTITLLRE